MDRGQTDNDIRIEGADRERTLGRAISGSHLRTLLAAALGALLFGAYAHFVGCRTGTCPITSSVWTAALYGGFVGAIVGWPARPRRAYAKERGSETAYRRDPAWK